ncbi:MAG: hypothetical protein AAFN81_07170 [Bacteroidota bacterium]
MKWTTLHQPLSSYRPFILAGHFYFLAMLVLSIVYYQERMLAMDTAYYTFKVIVHESFFAGHGRTMSYVPQIFPLLAMKLGWSLKGVIMAYSAGIVLCYYAAYNIIVYLFRNPQAGILLALALGLTVRYKFYAPVGESVVAMAPLILFAAWLTKPKDAFERWPAWLDVGVGIGLGLLLLGSHPFITISTAIALGFILLWQREWLNPRFWIISLVTGGLLLKTYVFIERNAYEAERANRLLEAWSVITNLNDYYISSIIWRYFDTQYTFPLVIFLLSLGLLIWHKRLLAAIYVLLSFLAILAIVMVTHAYMTSNIYNMVDGYLGHLGFIMGLPLAFHWVTEKRPWMLVIISGLLVFSLFRISDSKRFFQERLSYLHRLLDTQTSPEHPKGVVYLTNMNYEKLWIGWALGVETLMLSSLEGPEHSRNVYMADKPGDLEGHFDEAELFLSVPFGPDFIKKEDLPSQYFRWPSAPYREVNWPVQ